MSPARITAFQTLADVLSQIRVEIGAPELSRICATYLRHFVSPYNSVQLYLHCSKVVYSAVDLIIAKETPPAAARLLATVLESSIEKLEAVAILHTEMYAKIERQKSGLQVAMDAASIDKARGLTMSSHVAEQKPEDVLYGGLSSILFKLIVSS